MSEDHTETMGGMFDRGLKLRREVLGADYVDNSLKSANEFMMGFQHIRLNGAGAMRGAVQGSIRRRVA